MHFPRKQEFSVKFYNETKEQHNNYLCERGRLSAEEPVKSQQTTVWFIVHEPSSLMMALSVAMDELTPEKATTCPAEMRGFSISLSYGSKTNEPHTPQFSPRR